VPASLSLSHSCTSHPSRHSQSYSSAKSASWSWWSCGQRDGANQGREGGHRNVTASVNHATRRESMGQSHGVRPAPAAKSAQKHEVHRATPPLQATPSTSCHGSAAVAQALLGWSCPAPVRKGQSAGHGTHARGVCMRKRSQQKQCTTHRLVPNALAGSLQVRPCCSLPVVPHERLTAALIRGDLQRAST
jgi:hypothetical protein